MARIGNSRSPRGRVRKDKLIIAPVVLTGRYVRLEPLTRKHEEGLCAIGLDPELWRWTVSLVRNPAEMRAYIDTALLGQNEGTVLPFATVDAASGRTIGTTRFGAIDRGNRHMEIGWTWLGRDWQRTPANTEAKFLMLRHAFESLGCIRVEFKTDFLNEKSRRALLRIGAKEEGVLRRHIITESGRVRDSVYYSVLDREWPEVKAALEQKLERPYSADPNAG